MSLPTNRTEFKEWCLRALGKGAIDINVTDEQVEDRIDEALQKYWEYHFDGSEKVYLKHEVNANNMNDGWIPIPDNILGVTNVFDFQGSISQASMFDIRYQIALNDLYSITSVSMVPYYMTFQHLELLQQLLVGRQPLRFNRKTGKLYIDMNWNKVEPGRFIIVEAYGLVDPDDFAGVWKDQWLLKYATELIKRQWGSNLKKYSQIGMVGAVQFNGQPIYDEAEENIKLLEAALINDYSGTLEMLIG
jgi:hypothetical protein